jgi:2-polyprenyl-6-methoxyphenol hydroxylase-like FAD-dependent oxidoreductase
MTTPTHAIVLGASMTGLLTARVLTDTYDRVTIVDRDDLRGGVSVEPRRGVPQGRHAHGLLATGLLAIEELLPGATEELVAGGVPRGDMSGNVRFCPNGFRLSQTTIGLVGLGPSRPYLESYVRSRVAKLPGVTLLGEHDIAGIEASADRTRVVGARIQSRAAGSTEQTLAADLVVDATGRGSRTPRWLTELGYEPPTAEQLMVDLGYTSQHYRVRPDALDGDLAIIIGPTAARPRGGVIQAEEDNRAIVTLFGILGDHPPTDTDGFRAFSQTLPLPFLGEIVRDAEALDEPVLFRYPGSVRHRYDKLRRFPAGYLVIGDALCSFNPLYGQGMSVGAVEALKLRDELRSSAAGRNPAAPAPGLDAVRFFRAVKPVIDVPWQIATGGDLSLPGVEGDRNAMTRFINWYLRRLHAAAVTDTRLAVAFIRVANLLSPPPSLLRPDLAVRVLRGARGRQASDA